jgi:hypothetical protein
VHRLRNDSEVCADDEGEAEQQRHARQNLKLRHGIPRTVHRLLDSLTILYQLVIMLLFNVGNRNYRNYVDEIWYVELHYNLSDRFNFSVYQSSIISTVLKGKIEFRVSQKRIIVQKIGTSHKIIVVHNFNLKHFLDVMNI